MMRKKVVLAILVIVFGVSIIGMIFYQSRLGRSQDMNERLRELAASSGEGSRGQAGEGGDEGREGDGSDDPEGNQAGSGGESAQGQRTFVSPINFEALQEENPDIYGWIRIEDTAIDLPILQSSPEDPDYYEQHTVEGKEGYPGAIFTESDLNQNPFEDAVTVIYGHRMKDDTMFGSLDLWQEEEYREAHSRILVYTETHTYTYTIALVQVYDTRNILATYDCSSQKGYTAFLDSLEHVRGIPYWHSEITKTGTDRPMIILSTCYGDNRLLVGAVLTEKE